MPGLQIHAGILSALDAAGIRSTWNAGTSAGAAIAALDSAGWSAAHIADYVRGLRERDLRSKRWFSLLRVRWLDSIFDAAPIRKTLAECMPACFSACAKPLSIHVTREADGMEIQIPLDEQATPAEAVLASMSVSGMLPPVWIGDYRYIDGGTAANLPLPNGWEHADEIWLLVAKRTLEYRGEDWLSRLIRNADLMAEDQIRDTIHQAGASRKLVRIVRPPVTPRCGMMHFEPGLQELAEAWTRDFLARAP